MSPGNALRLSGPSIYVGRGISTTEVGAFTLSTLLVHKYLQIIHLYHGHIYTSAHRWISGSLVSLLNKVQNKVQPLGYYIRDCCHMGSHRSPNQHSGSRHMGHTDHTS